MNEDKRTQKRKLGDIGENVACDFLKKRGFQIVGRNYLKKWGEIDIIAEKDNMIHFVEVKSARLDGRSGGQVSRVTLDNKVSHGTLGEFRPEDNMHPWKIRRLHRAIQTYLLENNIEKDWQLDLITVKINEKERKARAEILENIVI
ncbi:MAG: YraN family protein [Minisyncoccia bacterium]